jgi:hypothetical protein
MVTARCAATAVTVLGDAAVRVDNLCSRRIRDERPDWRRHRSCGIVERPGSSRRTTMPLRISPSSPLLSPSRPLAPIILRLNARRKRPIPPILPWGRPVHSLTVGEFLKDYRAYLPVVLAQLKAGGGTTKDLANIRGDDLMAAYMKLNLVDPQTTIEYYEALSEKMAEARRLGIEAALKKAEETQEKMEEAEEAASDPVAAVIDFLLSLIGL